MEDRMKVRSYSRIPGPYTSSIQCNRINPKFIDQSAYPVLYPSQILIGPEPMAKVPNLAKRNLPQFHKKENYLEINLHPAMVKICRCMVSVVQLEHALCCSLGKGA
jgi:hypothetical protein